MIFSRENSRFRWLNGELVRDDSGRSVGPKTSITTYQSTPCNIPEEGRSRKVELMCWLRRLSSSPADAFEENETIAMFFFFDTHFFSHGFFDVSSVHCAVDTASGHIASKEQNKPCFHLGAPFSACCEDFRCSGSDFVCSSN